MTPIDTQTNTAGTAIAVGSGRAGVAITPDQPPIADFDGRPGPGRLGERLRRLGLDRPRRLDRHLRLGLRRRRHRAERAAPLRATPTPPRAPTTRRSPSPTTRAARPQFVFTGQTASCNGSGVAAATEIAQVNKANPTLATQASATVTAGGEIRDTATLAGGFGPTDHITFRLYGPDDASCSGTPTFTDTKAVSGNGSYQSGAFTPTQPGTYRWIASYAGDANNAAVAGACNDPNEAVVVAASPNPDPPVLTPEIEVTGLERDRTDGTATLTVAANVPGSLHIAKTNKVKPFGPVELASAGNGELEVVPRGKAAETLRRKGRITVNPIIRFSPVGGGEIGIRHEFDLRLG